MITNRESDDESGAVDSATPNTIPVPVLVQNFPVSFPDHYGAPVNEDDEDEFGAFNDEGTFSATGFSTDEEDFGKEFDEMDVELSDEIV